LTADVINASSHHMLSYMIPIRNNDVTKYLLRW